MNLSLPKRKATRQKLAAYKRHWKGVRQVQDQFSSKWIHLKVNVAAVAEEAQLGHGTVKRFLHFGKGNGAKSYSYFHGPNFTTIIGIADALDLEFKIQPKRNGK